MGSLQVPQGLQRALGRPPKQSTIFFSISTVMCFWSAWEGEMVNLVEVLTDKCVKV